MRGPAGPAAPGETPPPLVSIVVPCRDERRSIEACLDSILAADYPADRMEVLVVDGRSRDGTREVVDRYAARDERLRRLDNPERRTPVALNLGVAASRGEVILRMDAHTVYPPDYVRRCVEGLERHDAENVGGVWEIRPADDTVVGRAIAAVYGHPFGVGDAWYRTGVDEPREVDTVPFGCWPRAVFERLGGFDERLDRAQDLEFNLRLQRAGGRVVLDPAIRSTYLARSTLREDLPHRARSGFWTLYARRWGDRAYSPRHLVPLAAVLLGTGLAGMALAGSAFAGAALAALVAAYLVLDLLSSAWIALEEGPAEGLVALVVFPGLHASYGLGQVAGLAAGTARRLWDLTEGTIGGGTGVGAEGGGTEGGGTEDGRPSPGGGPGRRGGAPAGREPGRKPGQETDRETDRERAAG